MRFLLASGEAREVWIDRTIDRICVFLLMKDYELDKRQYVIAGVAIAIVAIYIVRLFTLQIMSDDYKKNADSNAFLKKVEFPSRGIISDRNGKLLVYNQPSYDIMVIVNEQKSRLLPKNSVLRLKDPMVFVGEQQQLRRYSA